MQTQFPDLGVKMMSVYIDKLFAEAIICDIVLGERTVAMQALLPNKIVLSATKTFQLEETLDIQVGLNICEAAIKEDLIRSVRRAALKPELIDDIDCNMDDAMKTIRTEIRGLELQLRKRINDPWFLDSETIRGQHAEVKANLMLAIRHLEDARMRCGKVLQFMGNGESIYGD